MVENLSIGRYIETNSPIHQLDPRAKLLGVVVFVTVLLMASTWQQYLILTGYTLLLVLLTKIPLTTFLKGIRPILRIIIFTALLQVLFSGGGTIYWQWGPFTISLLGIQSAGIILMRFSLIVVMTSIIGLSTKPLDLTVGIEKLLIPFKIIGFAVQDLALMLSIALRFVPTLFEEGNRLKRAQESRGMIFDEGHFLKRMQKLLPLFIPIFVGSFYRAQELSQALDVRGYIGSAKRTKFKTMRLGRRDCFFSGSLVMLTLLCILI